jgi:hypothetical protein
MMNLDLKTQGLGSGRIVQPQRAGAKSFAIDSEQREANSLVRFILHPADGLPPMIDVSR